MIFKVLGGAVATILIVGVFGAMLWAADAGERARTQNQLSLAERINAACPRGFKLSDWYPEGGLVRVTCYRVKYPYDLQTRAVPR